MKSLIGSLVFVPLSCFASLAFAQEEEAISFDGLVPVEDARVASAFIDPDADFSVFERFAILDPFVAFRSNWQRDQNRDRRGSSRISASDEAQCYSWASCIAAFASACC